MASSRARLVARRAAVPVFALLGALVFSVAVPAVWVRHVYEQSATTTPEIGVPVLIASAILFAGAVLVMIAVVRRRARREA